MRMDRVYSNVTDPVEVIQAVLDYVHENVYKVDMVDLAPCYRREINRQFMNEYQFYERDILEILDKLRLVDYSHTSRELGKADAYVFGIHENSEGMLIYLKFTIVNEIIVVSFHEPDRVLTFPYKEVIH